MSIWLKDIQRVVYTSPVSRVSRVSQVSRVSRVSRVTRKGDLGSAPRAPRKHRLCSRPANVQKCQAVEHLFVDIRICSLNASRPSPAKVHSYASYVFAHAPSKAIQNLQWLRIAERLILSMAMPWDVTFSKVLRPRAFRPRAAGIASGIG